MAAFTAASISSAVAAGLRELVNRVAALFGERADDLQDFAVVQVAPLLDALVHDGRLEHAQRRQTARVLGLHSGREVGVHLVA
jgi:hypothetical protein